jgi:hypothetical protein
MSVTGQPSSLELSLPGNLQGAVLNEVGLQLPEQITFEQWQNVGHELGRFQRAASWWIADWWRFGENQGYGERKAIVESEAWTGPSYQTCRHAGSVAGKFELCRRRHNLSFEHHKTVAALDPDLADELLDWCEAPLKNGTARPRPIRALREEIEQRGLHAAKSATVEDTGEEDSQDLEAESSTTDFEEGKDDTELSLDLDTETARMSSEDLFFSFGETYLSNAHELIEERCRTPEQISSLLALAEKDLRRVLDSLREHFTEKIEAST